MMSEPGEKVQTEEQPLPSGWMKLKLSAAIEPRGDKVSPANFPDLPFIGMDHVEAHTTKIIGSIPAREMKSNAARFYAGDILYGRLRPYLNKVAQPKNDGLASAEFIVFPENKLIKNSFLKYRLNARDFVNFANHLNEGDRPRVSFEQIGDFDLLVPPAAEQNRITNKLEELLSELDKGVENLRTAQQQLKVYRQALLKHAFEGKLTAEWRAQNPDKLESVETLLARVRREREARYQQQLAEWQEVQQAWEAAGKTGSKPAKPKALKPPPPLTAEELAELPELPEGWAWMKVHQLCEVVRGGSPRPAGDPKFYDGSIPFLKVADLTKDSSPYLTSHTYTIKEAGLNKTRQIKPNTLLLTNSGATLGVPKICLISATMNDGVAAFLGLPQDQLLSHYYFWQSQTPRLRNIDQGAAQPNLNTDLIKETPIPVCSPVETATLTQKIEAALSGADQLEKTIITSLQQAEALRQSILKKAFSGQLVPQHPGDEPVSVLLERIRAERAAPKPTAKRGRKVAKSA